ncbi:unnamed protein product [Coffea canephora]|uniref:Uncharacterized protein n=1 Tax=Coffea canephora TaxID=49390 RepID=A0A068URV7_COFCA|nr:unnamed protein product [Coffea canephora]
MYTSLSSYISKAYQFIYPPPIVRNFANSPSASLPRQSPVFIRNLNQIISSALYEQKLLPSVMTSVAFFAFTNHTISKRKVQNLTNQDKRQWNLLFLLFSFLGLTFTRSLFFK